MNSDTILQLRRESGAPLSACVQALNAAGGDLSLARALLQKQRTEGVDYLRSATGLGLDRCQQLLDEWGSAERVLKYLGDEQRRADASSEAARGLSWPTEIRTLEEIWKLQDSPELVRELDNLLSHKRFVRKVPLSEIEHAFLLVASMPTSIMMEGFQDLFYQQYSLADCHVVEATLRELGAERLAQPMEEARGIYTRHRPDISQEEYEQLDPFDLPDLDGRRFDEIAELVSADDSELFELDTPLAEFARRHQQEFS